MSEPKVPVVPIEDEPIEPVAEQDQKVNPETPESESPDGDLESPEGEHPEAQRKRKGGWQRKIERLERESEFWRQQALTQVRTPQSQAAPVQPAQAEETPEPDPNDFETTADYLTAVRKYDREQARKDAIAELDKRDRERQQQSQRQTVEQKWQSAVAKAQDEIPEYKELAQDAIYALNRHAGPTIDEVVKAIQDSDLGPKIVAHFGEHPEEVERLARLSPYGAIRELGKIEATLASEKPKAAVEAPETPEGEEEEPPKPVSKAPAPPQPVRKSAPVAVDLNDSSVPFKQWVKEREKRLSKG